MTHQNEVVQPGSITPEERTLYRVIVVGAISFFTIKLVAGFFLDEPAVYALAAFVTVLATWLVGDRSGWRASFALALGLATAAAAGAYTVIVAFDRLWPAH